jgi:Flp pilus assembly protein TadG
VRARRERDGARGAALAEFGIIAPLLFLLVFGIIEFGWAFLQYLDVKHGAREAGRLAAVNYGTGTGVTQSDSIIDETCTRVDNTDGLTITITLPGGSDIGDQVEVETSRTYDSLTGFFNFASVTLDSSVDLRLEQEATFADQSKGCP